MLSYRHAYHAGNSADVLKHWVIERILTYLAQKDKPCFYLDTHAGAGRYALTGDLANKTAEYRRGIERLRGAVAVPEVLSNYLTVVEQSLNGEQGHVYPGSPWLASKLLRAHDRLALCELHPQDYPVLANLFANDARVQTFNEDGFKKSIALLPPKERRGLIVVDPSYEIKADYAGVVKHIQRLHKRFATGIYAVWYPVVDASRVANMMAAFQRAGLKNTLRFELQTSDSSGGGMYASGMVVVNPPWTLCQDVQAGLPWLAKRLALDSSAGFSIETLVPESSV
ncbi:MAG TPA: 23S rRNA (adenine(2030)-N(6))-methyltransferase RlmJ [Marinagarivorans sp.]